MWENQGEAVGQRQSVVQGGNEDASGRGRGKL